MKSYGSLLASVLTLCAVKISQSAPPPHIVFILADDLGYNDVNFEPEGSPEATCAIRTPHTTNLARNGLVLGRAHINPICTPTRSSLMSGRYPIHLGLQHGVILDAQRNAVPLNNTLLPARLKSAGYQTHMVGKWHCGFYKEEYAPYNRGFDTWFGYYTGNEDYWMHQSPAWHAGNFTGLDLSHGRPGQPPVPDFSWNGTYSTNLFGGVAVDLINQFADTPPAARAQQGGDKLFLYLPFEAVHGAASCDPDCFNPTGDLLQAPQQYIDQQPEGMNSERRTFAGMVGALDEAVGNVTSALKAKGLWNNTLLVWTNDNGAPDSHFNGQALSNFPLRGGKGTLWEGGHRARWFFSGGWEGLDQVGRNWTGMAHITDVLPSLVAVAGGGAKGGPGTGLPLMLTADESHRYDPASGTDRLTGAPAEMPLDGYDVLTPAMQDKPSPRTEILHNIDPIGKGRAVRVGELKLMCGQGNAGWGPNPDKGLVPGARSGSKPDSLGGNQRALPPSSMADPGDCHLYNITADPCERVDLIDNPEYQQDLARVQARLQQYADSAVPVRYPQPDLSCNPNLPGRTGAWAPWVPDSGPGSDEEAEMLGLPWAPSQVWEHSSRLFKSEV